MFTGIVEEVGRIESFDRGRLRIRASTVIADARLGDSIAVSGCCLTVVARGDDWWEADVSAETAARTSLGRNPTGSTVNLERAVRSQDRLGGHLVQGHVDGVGEIVSGSPDLRVRVPAGLLRYLVEKGSVTVDGVSLTVNDLPAADIVQLSLIEYTLRHTTLGDLREGDGAHIEADLLGKYVQRLLGASRGQLAPHP